MCSEKGSIFLSDAAVEQFKICLNSFFQDEATGKAYGVTRNADKRLGMIAFSGCGIEGVALDVQEDVQLLNRFEMIVIDSGNTHGDSWKAIFHPAERVLSFVQEQ